MGKPIKTVPTRSDILQVIRLSFAHTVLGIVGNVIITDENLSSYLKEKELAHIRKLVMSVVSVSFAWNCAARNIVKEMRENGIEPILLKGQGIAQYYPNPDFRQSGDIDIYLGEQNFEKGCEVIKSFASAEDRRTVKQTKKHLQIYKGKVPIELHCYSDIYFPKKLDRIYQEISNEGIAKSPIEVELAGYTVNTPSLNFNVFYIFNHLWHHFIYEGVGLRQICDLCVLLHRFHGQIDYDYLQRTLKRMGLMKPWKIFGYIVVDKLGLPEDEYPFYDKNNRRIKEKVYRIVMQEGIFGHENNKGHNPPKGYLVGKMHSVAFITIRNMRILFLFPKDSLRRIAALFVEGTKGLFLDIFRRKH